ncbi:putative reverse transcriptase domain-containing protein [Tanacetum coccineum]
MNGKTYRCVLCYRLGIPLFYVSKPFSSCSRVFAGDIYGDHVVSCVGIISIKHHYNVVLDTLVDICYRSGISAGKEVDIGLDGGRDKPLRLADMLLYLWDRGLDVCVDLTGTSPLTQTKMVDFVPDQAMVDAAQRKRGKFMAKCAAIGYGFLPFSFSSLGELEADAVILLKRIRKFSMAQDIGARVVVHIFNRISFAIAKGVKAQIIKDSFSLSLHAWYLDDDPIIRDTLVVGKVLELIIEDGPHRGLHLNVNKIEVFWLKEDLRSRLVGVFPPTIARPLHGVKLLGGPVCVDSEFSSGLVLKRVAKSIELMDVIAKLNDPQCELLLLRACAGIYKLYFAMRMCSPQVFEMAQHSFDVALRSSLERIVTASRPGFGDWQWRLATLPFSYEGLGVYSAGDVLSYAFLASRLQSASLQTKLLRHSGIVSSGLAFDNALNAFNVKMKIDLLSNPKVDIGLDGERDKSLRPADVLLYSWDVRRDVCVDLTGSSPLTQTGMVDFVSGRTVTEVAQRKRVKYEAKCADIGYGFLLFSFSSFGELEKDAVTLLKRIQKFSMAQDIEARVVNKGKLTERGARRYFQQLIDAIAYCHGFGVYHRYLKGVELLYITCGTPNYIAPEVNKARAVMSSASYAVSYTSIYTDSEPGRAFWGADDEELSEGGITWVIVYGYDGLPIQPVAPPSPDYIPGPEDPQTPPVPQDKNEREPMFVQAHDPDYVPEPVYPEYIPLEDEHVFPAEEQPLPPDDSPTAESLGYIIELDPEEDPEEYEDDETEDGPADYPMDGGDDGDDDDRDSSGDDADDEDEEEEEYLALVDSTIVVPTDEHPQVSISLPPKAKVERLLAMTTPSPSPPISLLPPSTLGIASTQALIDAVIAALPLPLLPPPLYIPPPVDRRDDIPEAEQPPRKRLCLSTLGSRYKIGESSTARPTGGRGIDYRFFSTVNAKEGRQGVRDVGYGIRDTWIDPAETVPEVAPMTVGEVNTRVIELAELHEHDTQDLYALLEDAQDIWMVEEEAYASREAWAHLIGLSQATHQELQTHRDHVHETRFQMQQAEIAALQETDRRRQTHMVETLRVMRDMRREMSDMQAELLAH